MVPLLKEGKSPLPFDEWLQTIPVEVQLAYKKYVSRTLTDGRGHLPFRFDVWRSEVYPKGEAYFQPNHDAETLRDNQQFGYFPRRKNQIIK